MVDVWQAAAAHHQFSELVDAEVEGRPQFIHRRDGREVVVVSREYFEQTKPNLRSVLLSYRFGERGDALDPVLAEARATLGSSLRPREAARNQADTDDPGHRRPGRTASA